MKPYFCARGSIKDISCATKSGRSLRGIRLNSISSRPTTPPASAAREDESTPPLRVSRLPPSGSQVALQFGDQQRPQAFGVLAFPLPAGVGDVLGAGVPVRPGLDVPIQTSKVAPFQQPHACQKSAAFGEHDPTAGPDGVGQGVELGIFGQVAHEIAQPGADGATLPDCLK